MKVDVVQGTGLAGLVRSTSVDSAALSPEEARTLRDRVEEAGLLGPPGPGPGAAAPDEVQLSITVEDEGAKHTARFSGSQLPEAVRSLLRWIESTPGHQERIEPATG